MKRKLRKPYKYLLSIAQAKEFELAIKQTLADFSQVCQCCLFDKKALTFGVRVNLFVLAYPHRMLGDATGILPDQWERLTSSIIEDCKNYLDATVIAEPFAEGIKFQINDTFYIAYEELLA